VEPRVADRTNLLTPIDRFVQARLEEIGLSIGPPADRNTLLRRVAFDLTGLPPTPDERRAFLDDTTAGAYERMVDRYLNSPRFGERWGKYWLDAAGYADSNGYFGADTNRPLAFRYRDYVIRSLNANKRWDQFIREQLAGDEIAGYREDDPRQEMVELLEATHFLRNSPDGTDSSDGNPDEVRRDRYAVLEGTLDIIGSSLLGVSVGCARCHDHKFEPFTQREYYNLQAVIYPAFNVAEWIKPKDRTVQAASPSEMAAWKAATERIDKQIAARRAAFRAWLRDHREPAEVIFVDRFDDPRIAANWSNQAPTDDASAGAPAVRIDSAQAPAARSQNNRLQIIESGAAGDRACSTRRSFDWTPARDGDWIQATFDLVADSPPAPYVGYFIALRDFNDKRDATGGNILLDGASAGGAAIHVDYPGEDSRGGGRIGKSGYKPGRNYGVRVTRVGSDKFELSQVVDGVREQGVALLTAADLPDGGFGFEYCCNRSFTVDNVLIERSVDAADGDRQRIEKQIKERRAALDSEIAEIESARPPEPPRIALVADYSGDAPKVPRLVRGEHKLLGDPVDARAPAALSDEDNRADLDSRATRSSHSTGRRLAFATWLTQPESRAAGMLARVTVNRWWQYHFGRGIVSTPDNLGYSGATPSHPELLEYLAASFARDGWSPKQFHRTILLSGVYRQRSATSAAARGADPDNVRLSRFPLRRLDADSLRDGMLAASGDLDLLMHGPYVPTEYSADARVIVKPQSAGALRRSVYLQQRRTQILDMLQVFDAPSIVASCTGRPRTTVPLQSLNLLNSPFIRARSASLAARAEAKTRLADREFVERVFEVAVARPPHPGELKSSLEFLRRQPTEYGGVDNRERLARIDFCQMVLASNLFLYVE
jgi:hypothetical protein